MNRFELAYALIDYIALAALQRLAKIGKSRATCQVVMNIKDGRCLEMKVTETQRFTKHDYEISEQEEKKVEESIDRIVDTI